MSKRQVSVFLECYRAICEDIAADYPTLRRGLERDKLRLESIFESTGDSLFLLHLPALGKIFDRALADGSLTRTGLPLTRSINTRTVIPRLFQGLWLELFSLNGSLKATIDTNVVMYMRILLHGMKKFQKQCSDRALYRTLKEYYDVDNSLPEPSTIWDTDGSDLQLAGGLALSDLVMDESDRTSLFVRFDSAESDDSRRRRMLGTAQHVADRASVLIGEFIPGQNRFKHGPGATAEFPRGKGYKYAFPTWSPRLQHVFPGEVFATADTSLLGRDVAIDDLCSFVEQPSRLIAVPKTQKAPRLIAAEPTCHQWCQQSIAGFIADRIAATYIGRSINFKDQARSGELALLGSRTGELATIDLSSASDRMSCWLVERIFRKNHPLLAAMVATRTRWVAQDLDKKSPKLHKLRKFSSMGSALTFPVQSLVFWILCVSAGMLTQPGKRIQDYGRQVRVYGDDLIVPVEWVPCITELFQLLHLRINQDKTFSHGLFRESCGTDAYGGYEVTPLYVTRMDASTRTGSIVAIKDLSNNAWLKGMWHTAKWLESLVPLDQRKLISTVTTRSSAFGFVSFTGFDVKRNRFNKKLQRWEFLAFAASCREDRTQARSQGTANLLQYFTEDPSSLGIWQKPKFWESGRFARAESRERLSWVALPAICR